MPKVRASWARRRRMYSVRDKPIRAAIASTLANTSTGTSRSRHHSRTHDIARYRQLAGLDLFPTQPHSFDWIRL
jgi:hypothetical protein